MSQTGAIYNDFSGLASLKAEAAKETPEATRETARQFEALFVQMMLKSMRSAGSILGEERDTTYEEMFDQQIAIDMTRGRGIGIAEMLVRQLTPGESETDRELVPLNQPVNRSSRPIVDMLPQRTDWRPAGQQEFVQEIWPLAERAAADLDIDPRTLVAQAALETGWGQSLIRDGAGVSGNNLFGIKADSRWNGDRVSVNTLEYESGRPMRMRDEFRAYPNLRDGFDDYVNFLRGNPRYDSATKGGLTSEEFAGSLQDAGYATDPNYVNKIKGIANSQRLNNLIGRIKLSADEPI